MLWVPAIHYSMLYGMLSFFFFTLLYTLHSKLLKPGNILVWALHCEMACAIHYTPDAINRMVSAIKVVLFIVLYVKLPVTACAEFATALLLKSGNIHLSAKFG